MEAKPNDSSDKTPDFRRLRGYAFDPSLSLRMDTVEVNTITYKVEWEKLLPVNSELEKTYPSGEYVEIVDYDPASGLFYPPVNLNNPFVLAQDGLDPSVSDPMFHQQMVYAVVMVTIKNFEKALGRKILWSNYEYRTPTKDNPTKGKATKATSDYDIKNVFVGRLRIYPHALRQANAYYNPMKKALLFGYFPATPANAGLQIPGGTVFTCLSHDIIAHEVTHAILDGLHRRYIEPTHPDTRAFHEAFADIIALFQHFTFSEVLKHQISKTRGNLDSQNLLGQLAQEFGKAMGNYGSLRDAIGHTDTTTKEWIPHTPSPDEYNTTMEFHDRGSILVAAIFEAFLNIYKQRIASLLRIATEGTGILPDGELHPDLVNELANKASKIAGNVLKICVRALDYCPPVNITFGDYLRGILTADRDLVPDDEKDYRIAFIEAFQRRGIFPRGLKSMSVEVLCYKEYPALQAQEDLESKFVEFLKNFREHVTYQTDREEIYNITREFISGGKRARAGLHGRIFAKFLRDDSKSRSRFGELSGMLFPTTQKECDDLGLVFSGTYNTAKYQVSNLWLANRVSPDGKVVNHVIVTLQQQRGVIGNIDENNMFSVKGYFPIVADDNFPEGGFIFRGGATLIFDLDKDCLKYAIKKDISDKERMEQQFRYMFGERSNEDATYFDSTTLSGLSGPFAFMHSFPHNH
jgi:hypothetical protein